jgi:protein tyrosine/serine phosphatase
MDDKYKCFLKFPGVDIILLVSLVLLPLLFLQSCGDPSARDDKSKEIRPQHWAIAVKRPGLPNFYQITDSLYRGAQPELEGMEELKELGIRSIVNLRSSKGDEKLIVGYDFKYFHIPVNTFSPKIDQFKQFLSIVSNPDNCPLFVHCQHGADRTGAAVAIFRIKIQRWNVKEAIDEMVNGGYNFHKIHSHLKKFIKKFVQYKSDLSYF